MNLPNKLPGGRKPDPELDAIMASLRKAADLMAHLGMQDARRELVITEGYWKATVINEIQTLVDRAIGRIQIIYKPQAGGLALAHAKPMKDSAVESLDTAIGQDERDERKLKYDIQHMHPNTEKKWRRRFAIVYGCLVSIVDGYIGYDGFVTRMSFGISVLWGGVIAGLTFGGAKMAAWWVMQVEKPLARWIRGGIVVVVSGIIMNVLAIGRVDYMDTHEPAYVAPSEISVPDTTQASASLIGCMAWILFVSSFLFCLWAYRNKEEIAYDADLAQKKKLLNAVRDSMASKKAEKTAVEQQHAALVVKINEERDEAMGWVREVFAHARFTAGEYASSYSTNRKDGNIPSFLSTPPDFNFPNKPNN